MCQGMAPQDKTHTHAHACTQSVERVSGDTNLHSRADVIKLLSLKDFDEHASEPLGLPVFRSRACPRVCDFSAGCSMLCSCGRISGRCLLRGRVGRWRSTQQHLRQIQGALAEFGTEGGVMLCETERSQKMSSPDTSTWTGRNNKPQDHVHKCTNSTTLPRTPLVRGA